MNQTLYELYQKKLISPEEALARTLDVQDMQRLIYRK